MSTSPVSYCWAMAGTSPSAPRLRRAAISGSRLLGGGVLVMRAIVPPPADVPARCPQAGPDGRPRGGPGRIRPVLHWADRLPGRRLAGMSTHAKRERLLLADLLEAVGPEAPTLCEGWNSRDLAAHVV